MTVIFIVTSLLTVAFPLFMEFRKGGRNLLEPVLLFNYGFFATYPLKGFLIYCDPSLFVTYPDRWRAPESLLPYFLICWLAISFFNAAYYSVLWPHERVSGPPNVEPPHPSYRISFLILIGISVVSALYICFRVPFDFGSFGKAGGWEEFRRQVMLSWQLNGYVFIAPIYVGIFHLGYEVLARPHGLRRERVAAFAATLLVMVVIGSRAMLLSWVVSLAVYQLLAYQNIGMRIQVGLLAFIPVVGGGIGIIQQISSTAGATAMRLPFPVNLFYRLSSSYEGFENLVNMLSRANIKFDYGYSIFEDVFLTFIPRQIIPWKPVEYGNVRVQLELFADWWAKDPVTTYPVGSLAELYFNFDYFGVFLGMIVLGVTIALLRQLAFRNPLFLAPFCAMGGYFLAPHRWFGLVFLTFAVSFGLSFVNMIVVSSVSAVLNSRPSRSERWRESWVTRVFKTPLSTNTPAVAKRLAAIGWVREGRNAPRDFRRRLGQR